MKVTVWIGIAIAYFAMSTGFAQEPAPADEPASSSQEAEERQLTRAERRALRRSEREARNAAARTDTEQAAAENDEGIQCRREPAMRKGRTPESIPDSPARVGLEGKNIPLRAGKAGSPRGIAPRQGEQEPAGEEQHPAEGRDGPQPARGPQGHRVQGPTEDEAPEQQTPTARVAPRPQVSE